MKVIWSENAEITFDNIVSYLEVNFGVETAKKFVIKVDSVINTIENQPFAYKSSNSHVKFRKAVINKQC